MQLYLFGNGVSVAQWHYTHMAASQKLKPKVKQPPPQWLEDSL